jgi:nucleotidyltransferase/DNA polymerase involved in DNA repair
MLEFCGSNVIVEKASVDEAYMDLTKEIDNVIKDEKFKKLLERPEVG